MKITTETIKRASEGNLQELQSIKSHLIELINSNKTLEKPLSVNDVLNREVNRITSIAVDFLPDNKIRLFKIKLKKISQESLSSQYEEPYTTTAIKVKRSKHKEFSILCKTNDLKVQEELEKLMDRFIAQYKYY
ncbi:hypothetical protein J1N10_09340 [Carboxylicivirga sp. A043]|uniref:hypothetical protein n=1 Tax=Carboxylicivirga litoralis TaxID=2816963 RepID=UPI0021CB286C|nr:hypothetical protein [Carboxylicivirga sp. A043]MCU4156182.1 hypothetical protein [Carboxylicivirga sp. A043]